MTRAEIIFKKWSTAPILQDFLAAGRENCKIGEVNWFLEIILALLIFIGPNSKVEHMGSKNFVNDILILLTTSNWI